MSESQVPMIVPLKLPPVIPNGSLKERAAGKLPGTEIEGQYNTANEQTHLTSADLQGRC